MTTYYVDTNADPGGDGTTSATTGANCAWDTIADVNAAGFNPGDSILFNRGCTWLEQLTVPSSGNAGNPITFGAYGTGANPIITGSAARNTCIVASAKDYITIQNLQLTAWLQRAIYNTDGDYWIVEDCNIYSGGSGTGGTANMGINFKISADTKIAGGIIRRNTFGTIGAGAATDAQKEAIYFTGILLQDVDNHEISDNYFECVDAVGIMLSSGGGASGDNSTNLVSGNEIKNCRSGINIWYSDNTTVTRNYIHDGKGGGISNSYDSDGTIIAYNKIYNLTTGVVMWNGIDINNDSQNGFIYNNTVYKVHNHCCTLENAVAPSNGWTVKNNIFDASVNTGSAVPLKYWQVTTITSDYNDLRPFSATKDYGSNLISNPSFETFTGTPDDATADNFTNWAENAGTGGIAEAVTNADAYLSTRNVPNGTYALKLTKGSGGVCQVTITVSVVYMTPYEIRYKGLSDGTGTSRTYMYIGTNYLQANGSWSASAYYTLAGLAIATGDTTWTQKMLRFIPAVTGTLTINIQNTAVNTKIIYMDDFELYRQGTVVANYSPGTINYRPYAFSEYKTASSQDANSISSDPLFVNAAGGDFRLQAGSPAIDAGVDVGLTEDYEGNPVPV